MVDNFTLLADFIAPNDTLLADDNFYFLQLIRRSKDTDGLPSKTFRDFYIRNSRDLLSHREEIIELCDFFDARAYLNVNVKSYEKCANYILKGFGDMYTNKSFAQCKGMFSSAAGQVSTRATNFQKVWFVDYDNDDEMDMSTIGWYYVNRNLRAYNVPTKNGMHFLVAPHDTRDCSFADKIQKHNPTLLYVS